MAKEQHLGESDTNVKCNDRNIPENVRMLGKHNGKSR